MPIASTRIGLAIAKEEGRRTRLIRTQSLQSLQELGDGVPEIVPQLYPTCRHHEAQRRNTSKRFSHTFIRQLRNRGSPQAPPPRLAPRRAPLLHCE
jgi:hypothetical protein